MFVSAVCRGVCRGVPEIGVMMVGAKSGDDVDHLTDMEFPDSGGFCGSQKMRGFFGQ